MADGGGNNSNSHSNNSHEPPPLADSEHDNRSSDNHNSHTDDSGVWLGFEQSVAYLKQVAAVYQESFCGGSGSHSQGSGAPPRKKITKTRLDEAKRQTHEALELLASNLLNASAALVSTLEAQV